MRGKVDEKESNVEEAREVRTIDLTLLKVPDPRGTCSWRKRLCYSVILDTGVNLDTVEVSIDRKQNKVYLSGEYISYLSYYHVLSHRHISKGEHVELQQNQNGQWKKTFTFVGNIPQNIEVENNFVSPSNNLPMDNPILFGIVYTTVDSGKTIPANIAQFFLLSVE